MLHDYFTAFDNISRRYGLEKLKTIGDSYMCISGLPVRNPSHPVDVVMAAFEMVQAVADRSRNPTKCVVESACRHPYRPRCRGCSRKSINSLSISGATR